MNSYIMHISVKTQGPISLVFKVFLNKAQRSNYTNLCKTANRCVLRHTVKL